MTENVAHQDHPAEARIAAVDNLATTMTVTPFEIASREIAAANLLALVAVRPLDPTGPEAHEKARRRAALLPSWQTLHQWESAIAAALAEPHDEPKARVLCAIGLDGFQVRFSGPSGQTFVDVATSLLEEERIGYQLTAAAWRKIWKDRRSPPPAADILAEAKAARQRAIDAKDLVARALLARGQAEKLSNAPAGLDRAKSGCIHSLPRTGAR